MEVIYDLSESKLSYSTAANLAVYPVNRKADVESFAEQHGLDLAFKFKFAPCA